LSTVDVKSYEEKLRELCRDPEYALALFLRAYIDDDNLRERYAELYGLDKGKFKKVLESVNNLVSEARGHGVYIPDILRKTAAECAERFSSELENASREKLKKLQDLEKLILKYASYAINVLKEPFYSWQPGIEVFKIVRVDKNVIVETSCSGLQVSSSYWYVVDSTNTVLAKTGIAFYVLEDTGRHTYHHCIIPHYALKIIEELAKEVEEELKKVAKKLRDLNDARILSALLIMLRGRDPSIFEIVYGGKWYEFVRSLKVPGIYRDGCLNYFAEDFVNSVAEKLAKERHTKLYTSLKRALSERGFDITVVKEPTSKEPYSIFVIVKPGHYDVVLYVMPFPYTLDHVVADRAVLVFEGPVAEPKAFKNYVVIGMSEGFESVKVIVDNVNADWSREIAGIFKALHIESTSTTPYKHPSQQ